MKHPVDIIHRMRTIVMQNTLTRTFLFLATWRNARGVKRGFFTAVAREDLRIIFSLGQCFRDFFKEHGCHHLQRSNINVVNKLVLIFTTELQNTGRSKNLCAPDSVYSNNPHTIDDLKMAITEYIRKVNCAILNTVFESTVRRVNKCLETGGGHFEHYL